LGLNLRLKPRTHSNARYAILAALFIPAFYFLLFSANGTVFGVDARYHLKYMWNSPWIANATAAGVWLAVLLSFTLIKDRKQNPLFIGSLFLLNFFAMRIMMPDPDAYIYLLTAIIFILYIKNNPINRFYGLINHKTVSILAMLPYFAYVNFQIVVYAANAQGTFHTDMMASPFVALFLLPTYYLLYRKRDWYSLLFILATILMFPSGKFVSMVLPLFIYALYADIVSSDMKGLENDRILRYLIMAGFGGFLILPYLELMSPLIGSIV
jgi:hypothetical protein